MSRVIVLPQGPPADAGAREACLALLLRAGGDLQRVVEGVDPGSERAVRVLARLPGIGSSGAAPLVALTRCNPIALAVVQARLALEARVPALARAAWLLFVHDDPFFADAAAHLGALDRPLPELPIWTCEAGAFLVLQAASDPLLVAPRMMALESAPPSAARPAAPGPAPTPRRPSFAGKLPR